MLYLLTVADSIATGPMAWSDWKAALLRDFFLKVLNVLEKGELRVGMSGEQAPFNVEDRSGNMIGFEVDLAETLAEDGFNLRPQVGARPASILMTRA